MPTYPKRLIEVDLPIKKISAHARREKSIRHGHISTLHIWWARRPLAACRAVICAALWPDPGDPNCPERFKTEAGRLMKAFRDKRGGKPRNWDDGIEVRQALLDFIADFSNWDNSTDKDYLETSRTLTQVAHEALGGEVGTRPLVVDPFAGGGSIPLEALRVGADAFASDLNPVAVLLNKVVLEYIPKYGQRLADEVRKWGEWIKNEAEKELGEFYPKDPDGAIPIAYLWARTIKCEGPGCGAEVPLMRSLWLAKKGKEQSIALKIVPNFKSKVVSFEIIENVTAKDVSKGTIASGSATCPICGFTTPINSVRVQLKSNSGGTANSRLVVIRRADPKTGKRGYRLPEEKDLKAIRSAAEELNRRIMIYEGPLSLVPDEPVNILPHSVNRLPLYGMTSWGDIFMPRQALALITFARLVRNVGILKSEDIPSDLRIALQICLALILDRLADFNSSLCVLNSVGGRGVVHTFGRQALPMVWDFMETNPFNDVGANWEAGIEAFEKTINREDVLDHMATVQCVSATSSPLPENAFQVLVTDPPYYDMISYADLSDFFYVWLRRTLIDLDNEGFSSITTPKAQEIIVEPTPVENVGIKNEAFYLNNMTKAMADSRRGLIPNGVAVVVFAHKSTAGWEAQLQSMIDAGWIITGSWPIDTERQARVSAIGQARLGSSVHLACRPRENPDGSLRTDDIGDWRDVLAELPKRIHEWMPRLAKEGVVGADAIFACLGPALEIFSKYSRVEKASGEVVPLKEYLEYVWAAVAKEALAMIFEGAETTGFEEDARLTAMWLWTLSAGVTNGNGKERADMESAPTEDDNTEEDEEEEKPSAKAKLSGYTLEYDAARKIAQGLGAHLERLQTLVEVKGDKARLLPVAERTKALFGKSEADAPRGRKKKKEQLSMFAEIEEAEEAGSWGAKNVPQLGNTTLDRLHQAMILFAAGRGEALKRFLVEEGVGRDERFWRLAQALSALYPKSSDEKRWVDGVLARKKGLGF